MVAVPDCAPARNLTVALPLWVLASTGSNVPRLLEKMTTVPFCTVVPAGSMTYAVISAEPFTGTMLALDDSVMADPVGAVSGTLSQPLTNDSHDGRERRDGEIARVGRRRSRNATIG